MKYCKTIQLPVRTPAGNDWRNSVSRVKLVLLSYKKIFINLLYLNILLKPPSGVEPETSALQVQCSTTKLKRRFFYLKIYMLYKFLYYFWNFFSLCARNPRCNRSAKPVLRQNRCLLRNRIKICQKSFIFMILFSYYDRLWKYDYVLVI